MMEVRKSEIKKLFHEVRLPNKSLINLNSMLPLKLLDFKTKYKILVDKALTKGIGLFDNPILCLKNNQLVLIIKDGVKGVELHFKNHRVIYTVTLTTLFLLFEIIPLRPLYKNNNAFGKLVEEYIGKNLPVMIAPNYPDLVKLLKSKLNDSFLNDEVKASVALKLFKKPINEIDNELLDEILVPLVKPIIRIFINKTE